MDLRTWKYLFEFGHGLYIYAHSKNRVGVDKEGKVVIKYRAGPDRNPRCEECLAAGKGIA